MDENKFDFNQFDRDWTELAREICQKIYTDQKVQELKYKLEKNGYLSMEEKSEFINSCDSIKYQVIYEKFGEDATPGYQSFKEDWQKWFKAKGVESQHERGQRSSVDHILFGSTPDPEQFLLHFEHEMMGSMK